MTVRLSEYHDLLAIQALYEASGKEPARFWSWTGNMAGWWLIAEDDARRPLGCIQLRPSAPIATLELLCIPLIFRKRDKVLVAKALIRQGMLELRALGAQAIQFCLNESREQWAMIARRYGAEQYSAYTTYAMRLV